MEALVEQTGRVIDHHTASGLYETGQPPRIGIAQYQYGRQHDGLIGTPVVGERHDVGACTSVQERTVPVTHIMPMAEFHARQCLGSGGPLRFGAEEDRRVRCRQSAALNTGVGERPQRRAQFAHLTEQFRVLAGVRDHGGMERFGAERGCAPLEEVDGVCAHGHVGQGVAHRFPFTFAGVQRFPLHR